MRIHDSSDLGYELRQIALSFSRDSNEGRHGERHTNLRH